MHYPINWVFGFVLLLGTAVVIVLVFAVVFLGTVWRRLWWPRERRRRAALPQALARVESSTRITDAGDFRLVVVVGAAESYRAAPDGLRLKCIMRLPEVVIEHMERHGVLPVRVDPAAPERPVVDLGAVMGDGGGAAERLAYVQRGTPRWERA